MTALPQQAILVTQAALVTYGQARRLGPAEAHRELLGLLVGRELRLDAGRRLFTARTRSRTVQVDVSATVEIDGPLAIVVAVRVRDYLS